MTALVILASCGDDGGSGDDTSSRDSDVYAAIVRSVAADQPHEDDETPIVYVTPFPNEKPIPLDVQVGVVDAVADNATVRFVDEEDQAIDKGAEGEPVVDDGVLVRIGTVPEEGTTVSGAGASCTTATTTSCRPSTRSPKARTAGRRPRSPPHPASAFPRHPLTTARAPAPGQPAHRRAVLYLAPPAARCRRARVRGKRRSASMHGRRGRRPPRS